MRAVLRRTSTDRSTPSRRIADRRAGLLVPPEDPGGFDPWPRTPHPDVLKHSATEYGNRVGFWRMLEVLDEHRIKAVLAINGKAIGSYEPIARAARPPTQCRR